MMKKRPEVIARRLASQTWGGDIQKQKKFGSGIWWFTTAGHGGYVVDTDTRSELAEYNTAVSIRDGSDTYYLCEQHFAAFEEDCMAAIVEWTYPEILPRIMKMYEIPDGTNCEAWIEQRLDMLRRSLKQWNPDYLLKYPQAGCPALAIGATV